MSMQLTSNSATRRNYPYDFTFTATIVAGEEALTYSLLMENQRDEVMPSAPSSSRQLVLQVRATPLRGEHEGERGEACTITS